VTWESETRHHTPSEDLVGGAGMGAEVVKCVDC
jgi:hypothetical protein